jgi:SAM domain (Sterile alpha motif)
MRSWTCDRVAHCAFISENEITEKVLPNLTAEDLKELGVNALGHRRTLLECCPAR